MRSGSGRSLVKRWVWRSSSSIPAAGTAAGDETLDRGEELLPPAVIECQGQDQAIVVPRALDGAQHRGPEFGFKAIQAANVAELRALAVEFVSLSFNDLGQYAQDAVDLVLWAAPIVGRECPKGEVFDAELGCSRGDAPDVVRSMLVSRPDEVDRAVLPTVRCRP